MKGTEERLGWRVWAKAVGREAEGSERLALSAKHHRARGRRCGQDLIIRGPDCRAEEPGRSLWWGHVCPKKNSRIQVGSHRLGAVRRLQPTRADASRPPGLAQKPRWLEQVGSPLWSGTQQQKGSGCCSGQGRRPKEGECSLDPEGCVILSQRSRGRPEGSTAGTKATREEDA